MIRSLGDMGGLSWWTTRCSCENEEVRPRDERPKGDGVRRSERWKILRGVYEEGDT